MEISLKCVVPETIYETNLTEGEGFIKSVSYGILMRYALLTFSHRRDPLLMNRQNTQSIQPVNNNRVT